MNRNKAILDKEGMASVVDKKREARRGGDDVGM